MTDNLQSTAAPRGVPLITADRDTVDGLVEALCEAHNEGLHEDAAQQSCPVCQEDDEEESAFGQASRLP